MALDSGQQARIDDFRNNGYSSVAPIQPADPVSNVEVAPETIEGQLLETEIGARIEGASATISQTAEMAPQIQMTMPPPSADGIGALFGPVNEATQVVHDGLDNQGPDLADGTHQVAEMQLPQPAQPFQL